MSGTNRTISLVITILGILGIIIGAVFIFQGFSKQNLIVERMKVEKVTLAVNPENPSQVTLVNNADDAQKAADTIAIHRRAIAPTYQDLLGSAKFDPTKPQQLTYAQAMNLENYLYMAVMAFGLVQVVLAAGAFMSLTGAGLVLTGFVLNKVPLKS